jgi:hypothetical protein
VARTSTVMGRLLGRLTPRTEADAAAYPTVTETRCVSCSSGRLRQTRRCTYTSAGKSCTPWTSPVPHCGTC